MAALVSNAAYAALPVIRLKAMTKTRTDYSGSPDHPLLRYNSQSRKRSQLRSKTELDLDHDCDRYPYAPSSDSVK
jgi:hypothetical protein